MFIYHFNRLIRNRILWGFFAILIAFAFVAVDSCFKGGQGEQTAGTINGKKISAMQFEQTVQALRGSGRNRDNETSASVVNRRAWEHIAARMTAEKNGMAAGKAEVRNTVSEIGGFQGPGGFDMTRYRRILAEQGMTPESYERLVASQLSLMKSAALMDSATWVSAMELEDQLAAMTDRFTAQVATVSNRFAAADMNLGDDAFHKFYEDNKASFALPDRIAVRYVAFPVTNYLPFVSVSDDDLQEYYDSNITTYTKTTSSNTTEVTPFADVRDSIRQELMMEEARHCANTSVTFNIYGKLANDKTDSLALAAAQANATVKTSPLFSAEEPLYWVENAKDFSSAAFDLDPNRSDSRFGIVNGNAFIYVVERADFSAAHTPAYDAVLNDLRPRAQAKARSDAFQEYISALRTELRTMLDEGKSFEDAAIAKMLGVSTSLTYTVNDIQNQSFPNNFSIAYGSMTLKKGALSDAIPASPTQSLLVYVKDRQPGDALAAEMMRSQIRTDIARRRNSTLFSDWLSWNLGRQDFKPARPLVDDDSLSLDETDDRAE